MSVQDGARFAVLAACVAVGLGPWTAVQAQDGDVDFDDIDLDALQPTANDAATLQDQAIAAAVDARWDVARDKAQAALALDTSVATAQSRLVLARALEALGDEPQALRELDTYLALPLLDSDRAKGVEARERLVGNLHARDRRAAEARETARRRAARTTLPLAAQQQRGGAIGMLAGGAVPTILGAWFLGTDLNYASRGIESGTWAAIGTPLLITGLTLEAVGGVLLAVSTRPSARSAHLQIRGGLAPDPRGGLQAGLWGRF